MNYTPLSCRPPLSLGDRLNTTFCIVTWAHNLMVGENERYLDDCGMERRLDSLLSLLGERGGALYPPEIRYFRVKRGDSNHGKKYYLVCIECIR